MHKLKLQDQYRLYLPLSQLALPSLLALSQLALPSLLHHSDLVGEKTCFIFF
jgi:hypothetical protein